MYNLNSFSKISSVCFWLLAMLSSEGVFADGTVYDYDAIPPVISAVDQNDKPNVLVVLDNSGSMNWDIDGNFVDPNAGDSRRTIANDALKIVINRFRTTQNINMGLMAFGQGSFSKLYSYRLIPDVSLSPDSSKEKEQLVMVPSEDDWSFYYNNEYKRWYGLGSHNYLEGTTALCAETSDGYDCYESITYDAGVVTKTNLLYDLPWSGYGEYFVFSFVSEVWNTAVTGKGMLQVAMDDLNTTHLGNLEAKLELAQYVNSTESATTPLYTAGGTPIAGTLSSANDYFAATSSSPLSSSERLSGVDGYFTSANVCEVSDDYVLLITDGLATVSPTGNSLTEVQYILEAAQAANDLFTSTSSVQTFVVGFAFPDILQTTLDGIADACVLYKADQCTPLDVIAAAGGTKNYTQGSTQNYYEADTPEELAEALVTVFTDIVNRSSSGTGAAVLANNSRGDGAFYQALYVPEKLDESDDANIVTWVGVLNALFIDQYGHLREDTNGNAKIDDYSTDKVVEYFYDEISKSARAYLMSSTDDDYPTELTVTSTVDVEDLNYIWSARDQLADISSATAQRSYSTSADSGRAIYTSIDGTTMLDFVGADVAQLLADEAAATIVRNDARDTQANSKTERDDAQTEMGATQSVLDAADAALVGPKALLDSALEEFVLAQAALDEKATALANATTAVSDAVIAMNNAETAAEDAKIIMDDAETAAGDAKNDRDDAATASNDARTLVINTEIAANAAKVIMDDAEIAANAAKVIMDDAKTAADDAKTIMDDAETAANDTKTVMDDAETAANDAKTVMDDAETAANDAKTVMDDAETAAEDAETVMDDAETNADAAVIAKDDAYNTAYNTAYNIAILAGDTPADADIAATGAALADVDYINASALSDTATITHNNAITASDSANSDLVAATTASGLADTAFTNATTAFGLADTAFTDATTASGLADTAFTDATTASGLADTAFTDATTASGLADTAFNDAATAFGIADAAYNDAETASDQADIAYLDAEAAVVLANAAFTAATSVSGLADTAFTDATTASGTANANLDVANAEYDAAEEARDLASAAWNLENDAYLLLEFARGEAYDAHLAAKGIYDTKQTQFITDDAALTAAEAALSDASNAVVDILYFNYMELSGIEADKTVRWIRGEAGITDYRSREFDWYNDGTTQTWRLGDIIHSTPVVVASPRDRHDIVNGDETYAAYVDQYYNRRHVVYVGANDGMLHAFNAGFWNDKNKEFDTDNGFANSGTSSVTSHPLGSELWAYVPKAVLPHLQWLTSPSYAHTYYVDGEAETYDVNIFADDATHPNGWGTILVVPMRFGGGEFSVDTDNDGIDDEVLRSSISIFDITDPEVAPNLLAEISNPELGFTTSKPTLVKARLPATNGLFATPSAERWLLAFGSGPNVLDTATSTETAKLFLYDLETLSLVSGYAPLDLVDANSYVGSISSVDWNADYVDDALYFGVNSGLDEKDSESAITETGRLARVRFSSNDLENFNEDTWLSTRLGADASGAATLINTERTMLGAPITMQDDNGRHWIYGGTGRLLVAADNASDKQQRYYGVMEPVDGNNEEELTPVNASTLEDVTNIRVFTNGEVDRSGSTFQIPSGTDIANFSQFENAISAEKLGWYHDLTYNGADKPSGRNINGSTRFKSLIFYTEYVPSGDECIPEGESELHAVHYKTGTATPFDVIGTDATTTKDTSGTNEGELVLAGLELGKGLASAPTVIVNNAGTSSNSAGTLAIQLGTGELKLINFGESGSKGGRESWREIEMDGMDL